MRVSKLTKYLKGSVAEIKKVTWPSRKEAIKLTTAVIVFSLAFAFFTAVTDYGINQLFEQLFFRELNT